MKLFFLSLAVFLCIAGLSCLMGAGLTDGMLFAAGLDGNHTYSGNRS